VSLRIHEQKRERPDLQTTFAEWRGYVQSRCDSKSVEKTAQSMSQLR